MWQQTNGAPHDRPAQAPKPPASREEIEQRLTGDPLSQGYRPTLPLWAIWSADTIPQFYLLRDIELMMIHPVVRNCLEFFKGGISGAEFWGGPDPSGMNPNGIPICDSPEVTTFIQEQCQRFWDRGLWKLQGGYEYGWIGAEPLYESGGYLRWKDFMQFSPRDVFLLTQLRKPVGIQVRQIPPQHGESTAMVSPVSDGKGTIDLWMASKDVPAKGIWYSHNPRYSNYYGQSQLIGAWRPWRRLAWRDGVESNADLAVYRYGVPALLVRYPEEDTQAQPGGVATYLDSQGKPRRSARDVARQIAEQLKSGAGMGMSSKKYPADMGGGDMWGIEQPKQTIVIDGLLAYIRYLCDQISYGIGVPPELLASGETGSGYSGRAIPLEGFIMLQQRLADNFLSLFCDQILGPLVRWNFGDVAWQVKVKPLLLSKRKMQMGEGTPTQGNDNMQNAQRPDLYPTPHQPGVRDASVTPQSPSWGQSGAFGIGSLIHPRVMDIARIILEKRAA